MDHLTERLQVHVHVLLDRREQLNDDILDHLALELGQLGLMICLTNLRHSLLRLSHLLGEMLRAQLHQLHVFLYFTDLTGQRARVALLIRLHLFHAQLAVNLLLLLHGFESVDLGEALLAQLLETQFQVLHGLVRGGVAILTIATLLRTL